MPAMSNNRLDVHVYVHNDNSASDATHAKLDQIVTMLATVIQKENIMSQELDVLTAQVKANTDAEESAVLLIQGLAAQIAAAANDPAKIAALSASLKSSADALAAAVVANTPVVPVTVQP